MEKLPSTLLEAIRYFADEDVAVAFVAKLRWPNGPTCPRCGDRRHYYLATRRRRWKCKGCQKQYSVKVGTIFEDSPIGFDKWLPCLWMVANSKNGISSHEMARSLGVTQKTAWFMDHRIRLAMKTGTFQKLSGEVEFDEAYIGGSPKNYSKSKRKALAEAGNLPKGGSGHKTAIVGAKQRNGDVAASVARGTDWESLKDEVRAKVEPGSKLYTDAHRAYKRLYAEYDHAYIDHATTYVDGQVHTNGIENFWALFKRGLGGTYVSVAPEHLNRYLDEQVFRFNKRAADDSGRFVNVLGSVQDKRLTYKELVRKG